MEEEKKLSDAQTNIKTIHTYTSDMADAVRMNEASVIKIALAEQKKHEQEALYKKAEGSPLSKTLLIFSGALIIILAIGGIYYVVTKKNTQSVLQGGVTKNIEALISYDDQSYIDLTTVTSLNDALGSIDTEVKRVGKLGGIRSLFFTHRVGEQSEIAPVEDVLALIGASAPSSFVRSVSGPYMVGTYQPINPREEAHLFLLFQSKDFNQSYAGMLAWEKTLLGDVFGLFHIDVSGNRKELFERPWKDIIIENRNARILYDRQGNEVLYYIFINKDNIIVTESQETIREVSARLLTKKIKPL